MSRFKLMLIRDEPGEITYMRGNREAEMQLHYSYQDAAVLAIRILAWFTAYSIWMQILPTGSGERSHHCHCLQPHGRSSLENNSEMQQILPMTSHAPLQSCSTPLRRGIQVRVKAAADVWSRSIQMSLLSLLSSNLLLRASTVDAFL